MEYTKEELRRPGGRSFHPAQAAATVQTLEGKENPARYKSQLTLANRRIQAF